MEILFNWDDQRWQGNTGSDLFEELCYRLLKALGYTDLEWRKGSGDRGRDIECKYLKQEPDGGVTIEQWHCECKRYDTGVNVSDLYTKIAWADANEPDYLLFIVSSHLTQDAKDWIKSIQQQKKYRIKYWERIQIEELIRDNNNKISDIEKFFVIVEDDFASLYKKFLKSQLLLKERRLGNLKKLEEEISDTTDTIKLKEVADKYKELASLRRDLKEFNQAIDDLERAKKIYQQVNDAGAIFETLLLEGDINLDQNWGPYASQKFEEAFKIAHKEKNQKWMGISKFRAGQAFHFTYSPVDYHRALQAYQEALVICPEIAFDINLKIAELYLDFGQYQEFEKIRGILNTTVKSEIVRRNILVTKFLLDRHDWDQAEKLLEEAETNIDKKESQLLLDVLMNKAYIEWKKARYDNAISILQKECIPLVIYLQDEEKLMIIYQNISLLKQEKSSLQTKFDIDFWSEHSRWVDISNKLEKKYEKAQLKALYAEEKINKTEFPEAYRNLKQSKKFFGELNSWTGELLINEKRALLALRTGDIKSAFICYLEIADLKKISDICEKVITIYDKSELSHLIEDLVNINIQNSPPKEQIGICSAIGKLADVVPDELINLATNTLIKFLDFKHSRKEAFLALQEFNRRLTQEKSSEIVDRLLPVIDSQTESWQIKEIAVKLLNSFSHNLSEMDQIRIVEKLCAQLDIEIQKEQQGVIGIVVPIEIALTNIGKHATEPAKNKVIEKFKLLPGNLRRLGYLYFLGVKAIEDTIIQAVNITTSKILDRVAIHDSNSPAPKIDDIIFMSSFTSSDNITVTVGTNPYMSYLENIKDDIPIQSITKLINSFLTMTANKYNLITNKELLIHYLGIFSALVTNSQLDNVMETLFNYASGAFELSPIDKSNIEMSSSPLSPYKVNMGKPADLIAQSLESLSKYYLKMTEHQKESFRDLVLRNMTHKEDEIRQSCARCVRAIDNVDLDLGLTVYSLLFDHAPLVKAWAINSLAQIGIDKFHHSISMSILRKLHEFSEADSLRESLVATAYAIKMLGKEEVHLTEQVENVIKQIGKNLKESKYFSVREELISDE